MSYFNMTIATAISQIRNDQLVLPAIQRRFVWAPERMISYFDSLMRGYPTGVLLFWNTTQRVQYRKFIRDDIPDLKLTYHIKDEGQRGTMVLDGQQRLQSLYLALDGSIQGRFLYFDVLGSGLNNDDTSLARYRFEFLSEAEARKRNEDQQGEHFWLRFSTILLCKDVPHRRHLVENCIGQAGIDRRSEAASRLSDTIEIAYSRLKAEPLLNHYTIDPNYGEDSLAMPIEEILEVFVRINSGGQVLNKSDLMFSLMQLNWEEAGENVDDLLAQINSKGTFNFNRDFILRCALVCTGKGAKYDLDKLRRVDSIREIEREFPRVARALDSFVDFLVTDARILDQRILGSVNAIIPFIFFVYHQDGQKLRGESLRRDLKNALYLALMTSVYGRSVDSRIDTTTRQVLGRPYERLNGAFPLTDFRTFVGHRTGRDRIDDWLLQRNVSLLMNMIEGGTLLPQGTRRHRPEVDHIFPRSKLAQAGYPAEEINHFANFRLISKYDNIWKSNMDPGPYFEAHPGVAEQYLIPVEYLDYDQYPQFLLLRRKKIWDRVQEFLGLTEEEMPEQERIAPGDENRALDQFEEEIRDFIDARLKQTNSEDYWEEVIPQQTKEGVATRVNQYLKQHPHQSAADFSSGRRLLDFCDLSDYLPIIVSKRNWPTFDDLFQSKFEVERHLTAVQRWRNSVKHGREEDLVERLTGEAGILWFQRVLDQTVEPAEPAETETRDGPTPEDYRSMLTRIPIPFGQRQFYKALYFAGDRGLLYEELADFPGISDKVRLRGILGAFSRRINGTAGYFRENKPGIDGVAYQEPGLDRNNRRWFLRPEMREVLQELDPDWLAPG